MTNIAVYDWLAERLEKLADSLDESVAELLDEVFDGVSDDEVIESIRG